MVISAWQCRAVVETHKVLTDNDRATVPHSNGYIKHEMVTQNSKKYQLNMYNITIEVSHTKRSPKYLILFSNNMTVKWWKRPQTKNRDVPDTYVKKTPWRLTFSCLHLMYYWSHYFSFPPISLTKDMFSTAETPTQNNPINN